MKKQLMVLALLVFVSLSFKAPDERVFSTTEIVWCGLDFSEARLIGSEGFTDPVDIKERFFNSWNQLVLNENEKYNIQKFYLKSKQINDLSVVNERNKMPDPSKLVINSGYSFREGQLEKIIKSYDLEMAEEGLGVVYVVESLNKTGLQAMINVVFFDISSKEILWTNRYNAPPRGFGLRNYWAYAVYKIMQTSGKDYQSAMKAYQKRNKKS